MPQARWVLAAAVLGSGMAFLDGTVVNVALPAIGNDLGASIGGVQWVVNAYLVTLSALLLLGGNLGDALGRRRVFVAGLVLFASASVGCALVPSIGWLIAARAVQGVGAALLVPGSLAIIAATFHPDDRARAIGAWSGLSGVTTAIGPFVGGWLIDTVSWRAIFVLNVPVALAAYVATRHVPETQASSGERAPLDLVGATMATVALAALSYAVIEHHGALSAMAAVVGVLAACAFVVVEHHSAHPMLPLRLFRSRQFTGANLTTFAVYAALGGAMFLVVLRLQLTLGYDALAAGASFLPFTLIMLVGSSRAGALAQRIGARLPMTAGPLITAVGMLILSRINAGDHYVTDVLPGVVVFGIGMTLTVAPLTATVLADVGESTLGVASAVNNAVARLAGLLAVAALPVIAGIAAGASLTAGLDAGYANALVLCAVLAALGGVVAAFAIRRTAPTKPVTHPAPMAACGDEALLAQAR